MPRKVIVLSGGGAKGIRQIGYCDVLFRDFGVEPDAFVGVSVGSLNCGVLAQAANHKELIARLDEVRDVWFGIRGNDDIYTKRFLGMAGVALGADSLYENDPLVEKVRALVSADALRKSGKELRIGIVSLQTGEYVAARQDDPQIVERIIASTSIPLAFRPRVLNLAGGAQQFVDGGVRRITPLADAFDVLHELEQRNGPSDGVPEIYVLLASPRTPDPKTGIVSGGLDIAKRAVDLMASEIYRKDVADAEDMNELVKAWDEVEALGGKKRPQSLEGKRYAKIIVIEPERESMDTLEFNPETIRSEFAAARERAVNVMTQQAIA